MNGIKDLINQKNIISKNLIHKFSIAPMLEVTDIHFRTFSRILSRNTTLWTEMIHCNTIKFNKKYNTYLKINPIEKPVILQLGGSDPENLKNACMIAKEFGYDEINLNVGCPSERVQKGSFGACLMKEPELVRDCVKEMEKCGLEISVKCRLGIDDLDSYEFVYNFVKIISEGTNCTHFIIHARKAFLKGLNPKENRNIPPLQYEKVYKLIEDFPNLRFTLNGGIKSLELSKEILKENPKLLGIMMGRGVQHSTSILYNIDEIFFNDNKEYSDNVYDFNFKKTKREIIKLWAEYCEEVNKEIPTSYNILARPIISFFNKEKGAAKWRNLLGDNKHFKDNDKDYKKTFDFFLSEMDKICQEELDKKITLKDIELNKLEENLILEKNNLKEIKKDNFIGKELNNN